MSTSERILNHYDKLKSDSSLTKQTKYSKDKK